jgi:hypothetical protein
MQDKHQKEPKMTHKLNLIEIIIILVSVLVIIMALFFFNVNAQQLAHAAGNGYTKMAKATSDNTTATKADVLKQRGVPGKGIDKAPGLQKQFNPNSNATAKVEIKKSLHEFKNGANRPSSDNSTSVSPVSDNTTMTKAWIQQQRGVPGKGIAEAPGLQKAFDRKAGEQTGLKNFWLKWQERFREMFRKNNRGETSPAASD